MPPLLYRALAAVLLSPVLIAQETLEAKLPVGGGELRYLYSAATPATEPAPLLIVLPGALADRAAARNLFLQWKELANARRWHCVEPLLESASDPGVKALEAIVSDAGNKLGGVDRERVYLVGQGGSSSEVFYTISRVPDLWAAALAIQGNPGAAIDSNRLFGANTRNVPLLWIANGDDVAPFREKLQATEFNFETRPAAKTEEVFDWLASHRRPAFPAGIDCETSSPAFARCYWIEMTKFDPRKRNDVLKSSRAVAGSGASLAFGGFGFNPSASGPGILVEWLPDRYQGALKLSDRILSVGGRQLNDAREYIRLMDEAKEEKPVAVVVQRGKERVRLETRIVLPKRDEVVTARLQATYIPAQKEVQIITRGVVQMRVTIPPDWVPASLSWNGSDLVKADASGCWMLSQEKDPPEASRCGQ